MKPFAILYVILIVSGCSSAVQKLTKTGRTSQFQTKMEYLNAVSKENRFSPEQMLYLDSASYVTFGTEVLMKEQPVVYFMTLINDSVAFKKSDFFQADKSCTGRMDNEIVRHVMINSPESDSLVKIPDLSRYIFRSFADNREIKFDFSGNKRAVVLLFLYNHGTSFKKFYREIGAFMKANASRANLYIICADPVYYFKN